MRIAAMLAALLSTTALESVAQGQLYKCVGADGKVTYSDAGCPSSTRPDDIKAAPIAEPSPQDARAAEQRRAIDNRRVAELERQKRMEAARALPGVAALSSERPTPSSAAARSEESMRCAGIRYEIKRGQFMDPLAFDRTIYAMELQRAAREHCR